MVLCLQNEQKTLNMAKKRRRKNIKVVVDLDKALGNGARQQYLENNPHGYNRVNKIHKSKKAYNRKTKNRSCDYMFSGKKY